MSLKKIFSFLITVVAMCTSFESFGQEESPYIQLWSSPNVPVGIPTTVTVVIATLPPGGTADWFDMGDLTISQPPATTYATVTFNSEGYQSIDYVYRYGGQDYYKQLVFNAYAPLTSAGTISGPTTACAGISPGTITSSGPTGGYNIQYQWEYLNGATWTSLSGATLPSYYINSLTAARTYRLKVTSPGQSSMYTNNLTVTLTTVTSGSDYYYNFYQCNGSDVFIKLFNINCSNLYVDGSDVEDWGGGTYRLTLPSNPNFNVHAVKNGCEVVENMPAITIYATMVASVPVLTQLTAYCINNPPANVSLQAASSSYVGTPTYEWYNEAGATHLQDGPQVSLPTSPGVYRARLKASLSPGFVCYSAMSGSITMTGETLTTVGAISTSSQTLCYSAIPPQLVASAAASGPLNTSNQLVYQWEKKPASGSWGAISGATGQNFTPTEAPIETTQFRRGVSVCGGSLVYTNVCTFTVTNHAVNFSYEIGSCPAPGAVPLKLRINENYQAGTWQFKIYDSSHQLQSTQTGLSASSYVYANITYANNSTFYVKVVTPDNCVTDYLTVNVNVTAFAPARGTDYDYSFFQCDGASVFIKVVGMGSTSAYVTGSDVEDMGGNLYKLASATGSEYGVHAIKSGCQVDEWEPAVSISQNIPTAVPTVTQQTGYCGNNPPANVTLSATSDSHLVATTYEWYTSGGSYQGSGASIPLPPTGTFKARTRVQGTNSQHYCFSNFSTTITPAGESLTNVGSLSTVSQTICYNAQPPQLTASAATSGPLNTSNQLAYQWEKKPASGSWNAISGATGQNYNPTEALTETTQYRRKVTVCGGTPSYTNVCTFTVTNHAVNFSYEIGSCPAPGAVPLKLRINENYQAGTWQFKIYDSSHQLQSTQTGLSASSYVYANITYANNSTFYVKVVTPDNCVTDYLTVNVNVTAFAPARGTDYDYNFFSCNGDAFIKVVGIGITSAYVTGSDVEDMGGNIYKLASPTGSEYGVHAIKSGCQVDEWEPAVNISQTLIASVPTLTHDDYCQNNLPANISLQAVSTSYVGTPTYEWFDAAGTSHLLDGSSVSLPYDPAGYRVRLKATLQSQGYYCYSALSEPINTTGQMPPSVPTGSTDGYRIASVATQVPVSVGGVSNVEFRWYDSQTGGNLLASTTSPTYDAPVTSSSTTAETTKVVWVSTATGVCESSGRRQVTAHVYPAPQIAATNNSTIIMGSAVELTVSNYVFDSYQWTGPGGERLDVTGPTFSTAVPGDYTITVSKFPAPPFTSARKTIYGGLSDQNENYLVTNSIQIAGVYTNNQANTLPVESNNQSTQYFDGLGRPMQTVITQSSPLKKDIAQPISYDLYGRETKKYLPYVDPTENSGWFKENALKDQNTTATTEPAIYQSGKHFTFYQGTTKVATDVTPYAETVFEPSPLNRPQQDFGPGQKWKDNNKYVGHSYEINQADDVFLFTYDPSTGMVSAGSNAQPQHYGAGQLQAKRTTDEQGNDVIEYVDKLGHTVCKKVQYGSDATGKLYASTYYIYDDLSNLVVVLPPEGVKAFTN